MKFIPTDALQRVFKAAQERAERPRLCWLHTCFEATLVVAVAIIFVALAAAAWFC